MRRSTVLSIIVGLLIIILLFIRIGFKEIYELLLRVNIPLFFLAVLLGLLSMLVAGLRWSIISSTLDVHLGFFNAAMYRVMGFAVLYSTPTSIVGAETTRALLASRDSGRSISTCIQISILDRTIEMVTVLIIMVLGSLFSLIIFSPGILGMLLLLLLPIVILSLIYITLFIIPKKSYHKKGIIGRLFVSLKKIYHNTYFLFRHRKRILLYAFLLTLLQIFFTVLLFSSILAMVIDAPLFGLLKYSFLAYLFSVLSSLIPIPLGLGSLEAGQLVAFSIMGLSSSIAIFSAFTLRLKDVFIAMIGGLLFMIKGLPRRVERWIDLKRLEEWINFNNSKK